MCNAILGNDLKQPVGYSVVWHSKALHNWYSSHVIKNTTNQNAGKSLYIRRYYIQPCVGHLDYVGDLTVYSMTWYKIVMLSWYTNAYPHGISQLWLVFPRFKHSPACNYTKKRDKWVISKHITNVLKASQRTNHELFFTCKGNLTRVLVRLRAYTCSSLMQT